MLIRDSSKPRKWKYLFGPVPSRRLGSSLGVDIVPLKTCSQNCIYCQLGMHGQTTLERRVYVPISQVLEELRAWIQGGGTADFITISGSGEPTLHLELDKLVKGIRDITNISIAIITNGTLLPDPEVRKACSLADVVMPSLDAGDAETFQRINHPHPDLDFHSFVRGLIEFRKEYPGRYWLEVFLVEGLNTSTDQLDKIRAMIDSIRPDKVHLNTAVRPTAEPGVLRVAAARMVELAAHLGPIAEVIADYDTCGHSTGPLPDIPTVVETLRRRPCNLSDLSSVSGFPPDKLQTILDELLKQQVIRSETRGGTLYYKI